MRYDKSLEQVWKWKDAIYKRVQGMSIKKQLEFISNEGKKAEGKSRIRLNKVVRNATVPV